MNVSRNPLRNKRGMTLVELLTAVSISVIILAAAVALVYSLYSMYHRASDDYVLKSEANRIVNAISTSAANATEAEVKPGEFIFKDDSAWHQFQLSAGSGGSLNQLIYNRIEGTQTNTLSLSTRIVSIRWNGTELSAFPDTQTFLGNSANSLHTVEFDLQLGSKTESFRLQVKLLKAVKPALPFQR